MMNQDQEFVASFQRALDKMESKIMNLQTDLSEVSNQRKINDKIYHNVSEPATPHNIIERQAITNEEYDSVLLELKHYQQEKCELLDEIDELRTQISDSENKREEYREKYLNAETVVELMSIFHQLERTDQESSRIKERINEGLEIANDRFNEELQELRHLPFMLQAKQIETTEKTVNALSTDLQSCIVKYEYLNKEFEHEKRRNVEIKNELTLMQEQVINSETIYHELIKENHQFNNSLEQIKQLKENLESKIRGNNRRTQQIETLREESSRHITRIKERINEVAKSERKFAEAQMEIKSLGNQVEILRASYTNLFDGCETNSDDSDDENISSLCGAENGNRTPLTGNK